MCSIGEVSSRARRHGRELYLDNLKVVLIAGIVAVHAVLGYAGFVEIWSYTEVREVTLSPVTEMVLFLMVGPFGFLVIPLLFLVSGLLTAGSLRRKGAGPYVRDRLLRLGVPFIVYILLIQPLVMYTLEHPLGHATGSYWYEMLGKERQLDTGPLWFVGVLLIFSVAYAAWCALTGHEYGPVKSASRAITIKHLALMVAVVIPASFAIRLVYPYGSESGLFDLNFWEWPACAACPVQPVGHRGVGHRKSGP